LPGMLAHPPISSLTPTYNRTHPPTPPLTHPPTHPQTHTHTHALSLTHMHAQPRTHQVQVLPVHVLHVPDQALELAAQEGLHLKLLLVADLRRMVRCVWW